MSSHNNADRVIEIPEHPTTLDLAARSTVIQGESLREIMETIPDAVVAAVITDPPYSSGGFTRGDRMASTTNKYVLTGTQIERPDFAGDNRDQRGYLKWCTLWLDECLRITRPGGSLLMFTDWRQLPTTTDAVQAGGWVWRGIVPWDKGDGTRPRRGGLRSQAEYVVWATAGAARTDVDECLPGWLHVLDGVTEPGWLHAPVTANQVPGGSASRSPPSRHSTAAASSRLPTRRLAKRWAARSKAPEALTPSAARPGRPRSCTSARGPGSITRTARSTARVFADAVTRAPA